MEPSELANRFTYHAPIEGQPQKYEKIRAMAHRIAVELAVMCPESRELSLAITKLEEAVFWANAAVARRS